MKKIIAALFAVVLVGCGGTAEQPPETETAAPTTQPPIEAAAIECKVYREPGVVEGELSNDLEHVTTMDEGRSLSIDGMGSKHVGAGFDTIKCLLDELEAPQSVWARMENTRALDGTQDATWGPFTARWTYHPSSGIQIVIEDQSA